MIIPPKTKKPMSCVYTTGTVLVCRTAPSKFTVLFGLSSPKAACLISLNQSHWIWRQSCVCGHTTEQSWRFSSPGAKRQRLGVTMLQSSVTHLCSTHSASCQGPGKVCRRSKLFHQAAWTCASQQQRKSPPARHNINNNNSWSSLQLIGEQQSAALWEIWSWRILWLKVQLL